MIEYAKEGHNILVDACIGSGKTTSIQALCNEFNKKKILYLTYNRLLKFDAKDRIKCENVYVTNYNGYVYQLLKENNKYVGIDEQLEIFLKYKFKDKNKYDVLIIDEYQDIDSEHAELLEFIKSENKGLQIIAVGDECQKIDDYSRLNAIKFIKKFLNNYKKVSYTKCFRLSKEYASRIGKIWGKKIIGCNSKCKIEEMDIDEVVDFLKDKNPSDILCLGSNKNSKRQTIVNQLSKLNKKKFGKYTVYSKIMDAEDGIKIDNKTAIFTSYDACKGLERDICVICDFTESYWESRMSKSMQKYDILRNIFCVAMSRGKKHIIFVKEKSKLLTDKTIMKKVKTNKDFSEEYNIHNLFDYKYKEDVKMCFENIKFDRIEVDNKDVIKIKKHDGKIDLSPCIGIYQECDFFNKYDIDAQVEFEYGIRGKNIPNKYYSENEQRKILYLTYIETGQDRYIKDVEDYINNDQKKQIFDRLRTEFNGNEDVQKDTSLYFKTTKKHKCRIYGRIDVLKDNIIWELKFVNELKRTDFLQCAMYMISMNKKKSILWNTMKNEKFEIKIPNKKKFLDSVVYAITKGKIKEYKN